MVMVAIVAATPLRFSNCGFANGMPCSGIKMVRHSSPVDVRDIYRAFYLEVEMMDLIHALGLSSSIVISITILVFWIVKGRHIPGSWAMWFFILGTPLATFDRIYEQLQVYSDVLMLGAACVLPFIVRLLSQLPTPNELRRTNDCLARAIAETVRSPYDG